MKGTKLRAAVKMSIAMACLKEENKLEDGDINWNFVDADVTMDYAPYANEVFDAMLVELLNEVADEYYETVGRNKPECTSLRNINFWSAMDQLNADMIEATDGLFGVKHA